VAGRTGRFSRSDRLLRSGDFQRVAREGVRRASRHFVVLVASRRVSELPGAWQGGPRLGVTVSRKVGGAVDRNRVKRRIREWFRRSSGTLGGAVDVVVIARRGAAELGGAELAEELGAVVEGARRV
jgi:ribonuclease P protein component